jgi:hypothetical protein
MRGLAVADEYRGGGGRRIGTAARPAGIAAVLATLCGVCGGRLSGGVVVSGQSTYCSLECAQAARDRHVPGNYLG